MSFIPSKGTRRQRGKKESWRGGCLESGSPGQTKKKRRRRGVACQWKKASSQLHHGNEGEGKGQERAKQKLAQRRGESFLEVRKFQPHYESHSWLITGELSMRGAKTERYEGCGIDRRRVTVGSKRRQSTYKFGRSNCEGNAPI